jgi:hypothetical protein
MTYRIRSSRWLTLLFVSVALGLSQSNCSPANLSEADTRQAFERWLRSGLAEGAIRITAFHKTSDPVPVAGTKSLHAVGFKATLECLKPYSYRGQFKCDAGRSMQVSEQVGKWKATLEGAAAVAYRQEGKNMTTGSPFTRELDASGAVVSHEEDNKFSGLLYYKRWRGWQSEYD